MGFTAALLTVAVFGFLTFGAINGAPSDYCEDDALHGCSWSFVGGRLLERLGYFPMAEFRESQISTPGESRSAALVT